MKLILGIGWRAVVMCVLLGGILGMGGYTFWYAEGLSYFSNDPKSCVKCHVMREHYDNWQRASHHAHAKCNDCHLPHDTFGKLLAKAENGWCHSKAFTLQDFPETIRIKPKNSRILQANCVRCHQDLVGDLIHHGALGDDSNTCVRCHSAVGHGSPR